jgi:hypothetical protein
MSLAPAAAQPAQPTGQPRTAHKTMLGLSPDQLRPAVAPVPQQAAPADPAPAHGVAAAQRTVMGFAQLTDQPHASPPIDPKRTMLGMPSADAPAQPLPTSGQPINPRRTMLGMPGQAAVLQPGPFPAVQQPPQFRPPEPPASQARPLPSAKNTMLGVALPGIAPVHPTQPDPPPASAPLPVPSAQRTMLGVAVPGIAPVGPGGSPPGPAQYPPPGPEAAPMPPPVFQRRKRIVVQSVPLARRPAFVLSVLGAVIAVFVVVVALVWKSPPPIRSEAKIDDKGQDHLELTCASCPDGTVLDISGSKATTKNGVGDVALSKPLAVGQNKFVVHIDRPGTRRDEDVNLVVPIAYRIHPDLSALASSQPTLLVAIEAQQGTSVQVDGKPVTISVDGKGSYPVDVSAECTGQTGEVRTIDKNIPYAITPKGGSTDKGTVAVKVGVTPLMLDSPRPNLVVDGPNFLVAGRTWKGAVVEIEGSQVPAGADGSFARKLRVDRMGETQVRVRAIARDQAARTVTFTVRRVTDLSAEARDFASNAKLGTAALLTDLRGHVGEPIALHGDIVESRVQGQLTILLLGVSEGCKSAPCLVRLQRAGAEPLPKGEQVRVFGHVNRAYEAPGSEPVPEVDVDFLLRANKATR